MTQLGEAVAVGILTEKKLECPFHEKGHSHDGVKSNYKAGDATALGKNLAAGGEDSSTVKRKKLPDLNHSLPRKEADPDEAYSETEREVVLIRGNEDTRYPVAHSAHHLIPAKESLARANPLHKYIDSSKGKICCHLGYDVDGSENGVWLPGLHAVNSKGLDLWGAASSDLPDDEEVGRRLRKRPELEDRKTKWTYALLDGPRPAHGPIAFEPTNLKWLYVQRSMTFPRMAPRQFHDRHTDYSGKVKAHLEDVATVLDRLLGTEETEPDCKECAEAKGKPPPPAGLLGLLNNSSTWYRGKLVGRTRDKEYYTSSWCGPGSPPVRIPRKHKRK